MKKTFSFLLAFGAYIVTGFAQISINATIPNSIPAGSSVEAEIRINKGAISSFAKYQMDVPVGYVVTEVDAKGGNFTFENQRAKIVWVSVPNEAELVFKLKITGEASASNSGAISQKFFYLESSEKKEVDGPVINLGGGSSSVVSSSSGNDNTSGTSGNNSQTNTQVVSSSSSGDNSSSGNTNTQVVSSSSGSDNSSSGSNNSTTNVTSSNSTPVKNTSTSSSTAEAGVSYKIQLGAFSTQPSKSKFSGAGAVNIENIDGLYKVTTGNCKTKDEAIRLRDQLQTKGFSGFIVTYKNGQRVK